MAVVVAETIQHLKQRNVMNRWHSIEKRLNVDNDAAVESPNLKRLRIDVAASVGLNHCDIDGFEMANVKWAKMVDAMLSIHLSNESSVHRILVLFHAERLICLFKVKDRQQQRKNSVYDLNLLNKPLITLQNTILKVNISTIKQFYFRKYTEQKSIVSSF